MSRFYSFYELLNFWTLNYELGDDLHKTRWQGANIKATQRPSACVHLDSLNLSVWLFLFTARVCVCDCVRMCASARLFAFLCENTCDWESVWLIVTSLELVHYSLTVLPSEIPGSGCVTHTQTQTRNDIHTHTHTHTHTNKQKNAHIHSSSIPDHCSAF